MSHATHKITVVLPCYNSADYLTTTVDSVLSQSFKDFELIIIDDASTDQSTQIIQQLEHKHSNIRAHYAKTNLGPGLTRNKGIELANSNLVALIDADDLWHKEKLAIQYQTHINNKCVFSCTGFLIGKLAVLRKKTDYIALLKNNVINTSSVMFDKSAISIKFGSDCPSEDYAVWLGVAKQTDIQFINKVLVYRIVLNGISSNKFEMAKMRWHTYRNVEKLNALTAGYYMLHYTCSGLLKYVKLHIN